MIRLPSRLVHTASIFEGPRTTDRTPSPRPGRECESGKKDWTSRSLGAEAEARREALLRTAKMREDSYVTGRPAKRTGRWGKRPRHGICLTGFAPAITRLVTGCL